MPIESGDEKERPNIISLGTGTAKEKFVKRVVGSGGTDGGTVLLLSEDIDLVNEAIADMNVGLLKTIQDKLQTVNSTNDNFKVSDVICDVVVEIEATKSTQHGLIIRYKVNESKTTIKTNMRAVLSSKIL